MIGAKPFVIHRYNLPDNFLFNQRSMEFGWPSLPIEGWRKFLINAVINLEVEDADLLPRHTMLDLSLILMRLSDGVDDLELTLSKLRWMTR